MAIADGSLTRVAGVIETVYGTVNATPSFKTIRDITSVPKIERPRQESQERRSDRRLASTFAGLRGAVLPGLAGEVSDDSAFDDLLQIAMQAAWATDVLKDGSTEYGYTMEWTYEQGAADTYVRLRGGKLDQLSFEVAPGQAARFNANLRFIDGATDSAIVAGATYAAQGTETIQAGGDITNMSAFALATPKFLRAAFTMSNNIRSQYQLGSNVAAGIGLGRYRVRGEVDVYFESKAQLDAALSNTVGSVAWTSGPDTNKKYTFTFPNAEILDHEILDGGNDTDITVRLMFGARYHAGSSCAFQINRNVA